MIYNFSQMYNFWGTSDVQLHSDVQLTTINQILLIVPFTEGFDPFEAILKRRRNTSKSNADPIFHSQNTPYIWKAHIYKFCFWELSQVYKLDYKNISK